MPPVLPIHTQHHQSGDCTLEVTAHQSTLSQWSDRPVVRQLRFNLWLGESKRQLLAAGDQQHLVVVSDAVEAYVQTHLTHQAWPQIHQLEILDQQLELSTLQLYDLAEVLSAYGQQQITLPRASKTAASKRQKSRPLWWPGSAVASLLVAVGVTTMYLRDRPASFKDSVTTSQAPQSSSIEEDVAVAPPTAPIPEASSDANGLSNQRPETIPAPTTPSVGSGRTDGADGSSFKASGDLLRRQDAPPSEIEQTETEALDLVDPAESRGRDESVAGATPSLDLAEAPEPLAEESLGQDSALDAADGASAETAGAIASEELPSQPAPRVTTPPPPAAAPPPEPGSSVSGEAAARRSEPLDQDRAANGAGASSGAILDEIATQLAPYQPTNTFYPLVYHLQVSPDGTITDIETISENAPAIALPPAITPAPGRPFRVELIYTGANRPTVRELLQ